jgi:hypothetical protein
MPSGLALIVVGALSWWSAPTAHAADGIAAAPAPPTAPSARSVVHAANPDPCCVECPRWHVFLYAWVYGLDGTVAAEGRTLESDSDWSDSFDAGADLVFALNARVRLETGRWRFTAGADGVTLKDSVTFVEGVLDVEADMRQWSGYASVGYVVAGGRTSCSVCAGTWCLDAFAGVRYWAVQIDRAPAAGPVPPVTGDDRWFDPIAGLHLDVTWTKWRIALEGDVGGFGVGSDFSWHALASVGYRFNCHFAVDLGWRVLDVDRRDGDFAYDMTQSGPFLALGFSF